MTTAYVCVCADLVAQSRLTLCNPLSCSPPGSFVRGIFQARILEWVAIPSSRVSFQHSDRNLHLLCLLHCRQILYPLSHRDYSPAQIHSSLFKPEFKSFGVDGNMSTWLETFCPNKSKLKVGNNIEIHFSFGGNKDTNVTTAPFGENRPWISLQNLLK